MTILMRATSLLALAGALGLTACQESLPAAAPPAQSALEVTPTTLLRLPPSTIERNSTSAQAGTPHVIYVNLDGSMLRGDASCSSSKQNCSFIVSACGAPVMYPAFTGSATARAEILQLVRRYFAPFNVVVVDQRPQSGDYTMAMVGGDATVTCDPNAGAAAGVAPLDCRNQDIGENDIVFAFSEVVRNNPREVAITIAQEVAHSYGLEHTDNPRDLMYPQLTGNEEGFLDEDMRADPGQCFRGVPQNSFRALLEVLGPGTADEQPPAVAFVSPRDGATRVGYTDSVRVEATDNVAVASVEVVVDQGEEGQRNLARAEAEGYVFAGMFTPGRHTLTAKALDVAGNASEPVTISIEVGGEGVPPPPLPEPTNPSGGGVGDPCERGRDCKWNVCQDDAEGSSFCTAPCVLDEQCGDGYSCQSFVGEKLCLPGAAASGNSGGCTASPSGRGAEVTVPVLLFFFISVARRRRRS